MLRAIERDLRRRYAERYRVLRADSGASALDLVRQLKLRGQPLAIAVADQRMPGMSGVELLEATRELYPEAKRVLLTAYADTDAAIRAINDLALDYYLLKPWDPPDEQPYPVVDDLLEAWQERDERGFVLAGPDLGSDGDRPSGWGSRARARRGSR